MCNLKWEAFEVSIGASSAHSDDLFTFLSLLQMSRCSRKHNYPTSSKTLLVRGMFITFGMEQCRRDDYDTDASLEYSDEETYQQFLEFYEDVLPEFQNVGKVVQFKVCI